MSEVNRLNEKTKIDAEIIKINAYLYPDDFDSDKVEADYVWSGIPHYVGEQKDLKYIPEGMKVEDLPKGNYDKLDEIHHKGSGLDAFVLQNVETKEIIV